MLIISEANLSLIITLVLVLLSNSFFATLVYHCIIIKFFKERYMWVKWISSAVFFVLFGVATALTLFMPQAPFLSQTSFGRRLVDFLQVAPSIGSLLAIYLIYKFILRKKK